MLVKELWRDAASTGAVASSSEELAELITGTADLSTKNVVVEFGPGTGTFTKKILQELPDNSCYFCLEANQQLAEYTRMKNPEATVYHDSAENIREYLVQHGKDNCDCIISSLPWTMFTETLQENILNAAVESLEPGGAFLTYAYIHGTLLPSGKRFRKLLHKKFSQIEKSPIVWRNLPPAFVYQCRK